MTFGARVVKNLTVKSLLCHLIAAVFLRILPPSPAFIEDDVT
jgi:hypothetical protein